MKVVLDTSSLLSALIFPEGKLTWMRTLWTQGLILPLVSTQTTQELIRVLAYPKFKLEKTEIEALLADYLPFTKTIPMTEGSFKRPLCRDVNDQIFIDLALKGEAETCVTSDNDLLVMAKELPFLVEKPSQFKNRVDELIKKKKRKEILKLEGKIHWKK